MSDPERIWLQNADDARATGDRLWCQDKVWPECAEQQEPTEYIRADLYASRISQQDAELERMRRELADMTISRDGYAKQAMAREAEGRRKAFIEAAEIVATATLPEGTSFAEQLIIGGAKKFSENVSATLRAKAEETGHE